MFNLLLNWLNMNDMKNVMLNFVIGLGISTELLNITLIDVGDVLRVVALTCAIVGFIWKWKRQGMFKKDAGDKTK